MTAPKSTSATAPPPAWPSSQPSTIARHAGRHGAEAHDAAVGQHDDGARVGGQPPRRAARAARPGGRCRRGRSPRTRLGRQAEEDHGDVARRTAAATASARSVSGPSVPSRSVARRGVKPGRERRRSPRRRARGVSSRAVSSRVGLIERAAAALVARRARELADDRDRRRGVERQQAAVVLEQDDAAAGHLAGERVVRVDVVRRGSVASAGRRRAPWRRSASARGRPPGSRRRRATDSSSVPSRTAATISASVRPLARRASRGRARQRAPATRSSTAPQSDTTRPSKPHSPRSTSVSSHWFCEA